MSNLPKNLALWLIRLYQFLTHYVPKVCRFYPSCSAYMAQAIVQHGLRHGLPLGFGRLFRCHPLHPGGVDPVPCSGHNKRSTA